MVLRELIEDSFHRQYPEVWVTTPSRTRIAQWRNVSNIAGLVHLSMVLADEPEEVRQQHILYI